MKPCCTLYLVRHGQTQWNIDHIIQGHANIPLTKIGEKQAQDQCYNFKNINFSKMYSSDLIRAHKTAEVLNGERKLAIQTTEALRERNFGLYEGKHSDEAKKKLWGLLSQYDGGHPHLSESGVEPNEQVIGRVITFLREVSVAHSNENILIVTHGGIMRLLLVHLGYAKEDEFPSGAIPNLSCIKVDCDGVDFFVRETSRITLKNT